jgi:HK97 gp10 family phage protein
MPRNRIKVDYRGIAALKDDPDILGAVEDFTDSVVVPRVKERAPKASGAGAASIHSEPDPNGGGTLVSWDQDHFYMGFAELGTEHQPATPFMRPVADELNSQG